MASARLSLNGSKERKDGARASLTLHAAEFGTIDLGSLPPFPLDCTEPKLHPDGCGCDAEKDSRRESKMTSILIGGIPLAAFFILVVELCERFCFYGATTVFTTYMTDMLEFSTTTINAISNAFNFWAYFTALIGGYIADTYLGKFRTILSFAVVYGVGMLLLTLSAAPFSYGDFPYNPAGGWAIPGFGVALFLVGLGTGAIKCCVSPMVADQLRNASDAAIERVFRLFYLSINIGSFVGILITPFLHHLGPAKYTIEMATNGTHSYPVITSTVTGTDYWLSYLIPTVIFVVGIAMFVVGYKWYVDRPPTGSMLTHLKNAVVSAIRNRRGQIKNKKHWLDWAKTDDPAFNQRVDDFKATLKACRVFFFFIIYFLLYNSMQNNFVLQGGWMDLPSWLTADQLQVVDPLMLIILIPLFDAFFFPYLRKKGHPLGPIARMTIGFIIAGVGFIYVGVLQYYIAQRGSWDNDGNYVANPGESPITVWWQIPPYAFIAISEILASITALEFAYSQAPTSMKGTVMALYLLSIAASSLLGLAMSPAMTPQNMTVVFFSMSGAMLVFAALFWILFRKYKVVSCDEPASETLPETTPSQAPLAMPSSNFPLVDNRKGKAPEATTTPSNGELPPAHLPSQGIIKLSAAFTAIPAVNEGASKPE